MKEIRYFTVVGLKHYAFSFLKSKINNETYLILRREPENFYDKNAISVWYEDEEGGLTQIGYIAKYETSVVKDIYKHKYKVVVVHKENTIVISEEANEKYKNKGPIGKLIIDLKNKLTT